MVSMILATDSMFKFLNSLSFRFGAFNGKGGFPGGSDGKESTYSVGDLDSVPGLEDLLWEGTATHSSILAWRIPVDRGA